MNDLFFLKDLHSCPNNVTLVRGGHLSVCSVTLICLTPSKNLRLIPTFGCVFQTCRSSWTLYFCWIHFCWPSDEGSLDFNTQELMFIFFLCVLFKQSPYQLNHDQTPTPLVLTFGIKSGTRKDLLKLLWNIPSFIKLTSPEAERAHHCKVTKK